MVSLLKPIVLTQYPRLQECSPVTFLFPRILLWIRTRLLPLINSIANVTLCLDGMLARMWIWFGIRCPSSSSISRCWPTSLITYPTCFFSVSYGFLFRYLGMTTIWYLYSHRTWDRFCHSCIGSSSLSFHGTFPREEPILPRIDRTYPGLPPEVEGLVRTNKHDFHFNGCRFFQTRQENEKSAT
jgi:hypothetical protein